MTGEMLFRRQEKDRLYICTDSGTKYPIFNERSLEVLTDSLEYALSSKSVRFLIIHGKDDSFSAGLDLKGVQGPGALRVTRLVSKGAALLNQLESSDKVAVAAVSGYCIGGGLELAMATDYIIASPDAKFGLPEIKIGIIPGADGIKRLVRSIGKRRALPMLLEGSIISAEHALEFGLINEIVPKRKLLKRAEQIADDVSKKNPFAVKMIKRLANKAPFEDITKEQTRLFEKSLQTPFAKQAISDFLGRKKKG
jgi:enoyl-CoA hydratase/carnithine racemase